MAKNDGVCTLVERVPPLLVLEPQLHRPSSHRAVRSAMRLSQQIYLDLILSPFQLLYVTIRAYGRKANRLAGHNSQVRPLPNVCGSFGGFECMVLELVGLRAPHAHHDRCRYGTGIVLVSDAR